MSSGTAMVGCVSFSWNAALSENLVQSECLDSYRAITSYAPPGHRTGIIVFDDTLQSHPHFLTQTQDENVDMSPVAWHVL